MPINQCINTKEIKIYMKFLSINKIINDKTIIGTTTNLSIAINITIIGFFKPWKVALLIKKNGKAGNIKAEIFK